MLAGCVVTVVSGSVAAAASAADRVYWTNEGPVNKISYAQLNGTSGADLSTGSATVNDPEGAALDPGAGRLYWANEGSNKISVAKLDGTGGGDLATGAATVNSPVSVALDLGAGRIYWGNYSGNKISFARLDGLGGGDLNTGTATVNGPFGVALDPAAGRIYWANANGNKISYAKLDGTGGGDLATGTATVTDPAGVAVDPGAGRIYWANDSGNKISYAKLDGTGGGDLNTGSATVNEPDGVALDPSAGRIYWANNGGTNISFAKVDGTGGGDLNTGMATANSPEFPALLELPRGLSAPAVTGGSVAGSALACSSGAWAGDLGAAHLYRAPQSTTYQWTRNGNDVPGATTSSFTATQAGLYSCRVSATNAAGSATQTSAAQKVLGRARITKAKVRRGTHSARFSFRGSPGTTGLKCALVKARKKGKKRPKPSFKRCKSPKSYKRLKPGKYTFEVRALSAAGPGPVTKKRFRI